MHKTLICLFLIAFAILAWNAARPGNADPVRGLPGARRIMHAEEYPSLHDAFAAVSEHGGMLQLPAGEFHIQKPLVISRDDVTVVGAGGATHIINDNKEGAPAILIAHPQAKRSGGADRNHNLWRIRVANLRVTGNEKSGPGVIARYINEIHVDGTTLSYHGGDGLLLDYCYEDPRISDSLFTYNRGVGVNLLGCHDIVVSSNQFEENQDGLHCKDGFNLTMSGNNLDDHLGRGVVIENTYGSVVASNMIEECAKEAIVLDRDCYGITVSANVIAHNGAGVDLRDAHGCAVSANTFTLMKTHALRIGPESGRIAVSGNSFCDSYIGGAQRRREGDRQAGGLVLEEAEDIAVTGNLFSGLAPTAVQSVASTRVLFANNVLTAGKFGLETLPTKDSRVENNLTSQGESD